MPTLRQYLTEQEYREVTADYDTLVTDQLLNQAETLIDNTCAEFYGSALARSIDYTELFENVAVTATTATLPTTNYIDHWKYCTIEILNGSKAGRKSLVTSSNGSQATFDSISGLTGTISIKIFQTGKFPMKKDVTTGSGTYYKSVPWEVKQAVAWQVKFISENPNLFDSSLLQSESIGGSYSYSRGSISDKKSMVNLLAPQTIQLLKPYLSQTI